MRFLIGYVSRCWLTKLGYCNLGDELSWLIRFAEDHLSL